MSLQNWVDLICYGTAYGILLPLLIWKELKPKEPKVGRHMDVEHD